MPRITTREHNDRLLTSPQFDERKGATWHCIVGRNFGSFVTHGLSAELIDSLKDFRLTKTGRDEAFHLFLLGPLRDFAVQDAVVGNR